ncbi:hypothetical protein [Chondromyces apiculatus]|uniref:Uncharacterized protein n=1 Tax=Chondromyces apiculatus DSM 436 TaxID=1192034 RepID=A0A017SZY9_9BACT|nr:hypothetical protein [Chondromyces apiculatus]EYF02165.1 Hypothetical protein CAP_7376 [Chondromyces apiculatus DSM 436]
MTLRAELREEARRLWGEEAIVEVEAAVTCEGELCEPSVVGLRPALKVRDALVDHDRSRGALGAVWGTDDVRDYMDSLWPRST